VKLEVRMEYAFDGDSKPGQGPDGRRSKSRSEKIKEIDRARAAAGPHFLAPAVAVAASAVGMGWIVTGVRRPAPWCRG